MTADLPLAGLRVGVTAARRGRELCTALERRGAATLWAPTLQADVPAPDASLLAQTDAVLDAAPVLLAASTGVGVRTWVELADRHGRGEPLRRLLRSAVVAARGAKAHGALRCLDVLPAFVSPAETEEDVAAWLAARVELGGTVAVQLHGGPGADRAYRRLEGVGARVLFVAPYHCALPADTMRVAELVRAASVGALDVVVATSAPAVDNLFAIAAERAAAGALRAALRDGVAAAAVGAVTASAFERAGVPVAVTPKRPRVGDLIATLERWAARGTQGALGGGIELVPEQGAARTGGGVVPLTATQFAVLAALVRRPSVACPPELLAREVWGHQVPGDPQWVKHQIAALRGKLGPAAAAIQTVRGVGYRYEPDHTCRQRPMLAPR